MSNLLSYAGWTFLPNLVTGWLQSLYYGITVRAGDPRPAPGSPRYMKHRRRIYILVILAYLLYTIIEADWELRRAGDFYQDLGLPYNVEEKTIKSRFRRLAALHHPDKISSAEARSQSEAYFVHLKQAQDTLLEPAKRFAYERFGPDILHWKHCSSRRDYILTGVQSIVPYYAAGGMFMIFLGMLGYFEWGRYWRYLFFSALLVFEVHTVTRPYFPPISSKLVTPVLSVFTLRRRVAYLPFQQLVLARKITLTLFIALGQLGPLFQLQAPPSSNGAAKDPKSITQQNQQLNRLEQFSRAADFEATRLMGLEMAPFAGDTQALREVRAKLKDWLVQNTIRADPEVRDAVGRVMNRRRTDAPTGARGTR
ncbi:hypothetical protein L228DRAFT_94160 [Xylona heveae TC161]|uniref:J domain-containing protein n=1 Tax=Xylona heveae (strain CBS 132557 / TC161) TaxID=1328760 RepID=A0A165I378_XYLHT|nr:hypothetical protein L228DRAFT_94160 [Xylona heveae TC161]KZF24311.1 hypothetical protein L228DRAFT_94160 [Xylona heveae TC161]